MEALCTLIVDDSQVMRKIVARALRQTGLPIARILEAGNGAEALDIMRREKLDLVLTDINMPQMDGLRFVRELAAEDAQSTVPVLMITSEGSESSVLQAIACGAKGYIKKPFTAQQIKERVLPLLFAIK